MNKDQKSLLAEYANRLSEDDLRFLLVRLTDRLAGDMYEVLSFLSKNENIDSILSTASKAEDLFVMCDQVREVLAKESKRRGFLGRQPV